jgi:hypothetical protein
MILKLKLKEIGLQLCTCTWIEIMTGVGLTLYLVLAMHNYVLAALAAGLFAPLVGFHYILTLISKRDGLVTIEGVRRTNEKLERRLYKGLERPQLNFQLIHFCRRNRRRLRHILFLLFLGLTSRGTSLTSALLSAL